MMGCQHSGSGHWPRELRSPRRRPGSCSSHSCSCSQRLRSWPGRVGEDARFWGSGLSGSRRFVVAGFWYVRNYRLTGNPLYPLHLQLFGRVWLAGWYGPGVMHQSPYYIPFIDWRALVDLIVIVLDPRMLLVWMVALAGGWSWRRSKRSTEDALVWAIAGLAVMNIAVYWIAIPYRTQQRFMLHAVGLASVPLARLFDRSRWLSGLGIVLLAVHLVTPYLWLMPSTRPPWDLARIIPDDAAQPVSAFPVDRQEIEKLFRSSEVWLTYAGRDATGLGAILVAWAWLRAFSMEKPRRWLVPALCSSALLLGASALFYPWDCGRATSLLASFSGILPRMGRGQPAIRKERSRDRLRRNRLAVLPHGRRAPE